jgi:hypothetical protein
MQGALGNAPTPCQARLALPGGGRLGLAQSRRAQTRYPRLAIAGLVLGIIGVTVGFFLVAMVAGSDTPS